MDNREYKSLVPMRPTSNTNNFKQEESAEEINFNYKWIKFGVFALVLIPDPIILIKIAAVSVVFAVTVYLEKVLAD